MILQQQNLFIDKAIASVVSLIEKYTRHIQRSRILRADYASTEQYIYQNSLQATFSFAIKIAETVFP